MIISPQTGKAIPPQTDEQTRPLVAFLNQDGSLSYDDLEISPQGVLCSQADWKKFGKVHKVGDKYTYFIKQWRGGRPGELLVDPYGLFTRPEDMSAFAVQRGVRFCEYYEIRQDLFDQYVTYLKTRNPIFFKTVERAILSEVK